MPTPFDNALNKTQSQLRKEHSRGFILSLITLGICRNTNNIQRMQRDIDNLNLCIAEYSECEHRDETVNTELDGIQSFPNTRVSKYSTVDMPTTYSLNYGVEWPNLRKQILDRDGHQCQEADGRCSGELHVHHKIALSRRGTHNQKNLITLCKYHHSLKHPHMRGDHSGSIWL